MIDHLSRVETIATVFNGQGKTATLPNRFNSQRDTDKSVPKIIETLGTLLVVEGKTVGIVLERRIEPQHTVLKRIAVQLAHHRMQCTALVAQPMHLEQRLQHVGHGIEAFEGGAAKLETGRPVEGA